jgi:hypothetical protein
MEHRFGCSSWSAYVPTPVCEQYPEWEEFYRKAWKLAFDHIKWVDGMPQTPYMDEGFCDTQVWIWDSCFMALFCKYARAVFPGVETLGNFYELLYGGKRFPRIVPTPAEPSWTGAVPGEPFEMQLHIADNPPLFAWVEYENARMHDDKEHIRDLLYRKQYLQKHYFWIESLDRSVTPPGVHAPTCLLHEELGYKWEGGRSGMDNTPRGRTSEHALAERPNNPDMLWIDAICQQALSARAIADLFRLVGDEQGAAEWERRYAEKKQTVNALYWDAEDAFYFDVDCNTHAHLKVKSIASYWTLAAGIASEDRAHAMLEHLLDPGEFGGIVPFPSLSRSDGDYAANGRYWRGGVWLPTAYMTLKGLARYGYYREAHDAARKLLAHMYHTYVRYAPHTIWECYSPETLEPATTTDGKGIVRPDFCGWSALGPISVFIEFVLGFHTVSAAERLVEWEKPDDLKGRIGIRNLRFGEIVTDIVEENGVCRVKSNAAYTLKINGRAWEIRAGETEIDPAG